MDTEMDTDERRQNVTPAEAQRRTEGRAGAAALGGGRWPAHADHRRDDALDRP
jgi:hypothetical protein